MKIRLICGLALGAVLALAAVAQAGATKPTVVRAGNLVLSANGGVAPKKLSARKLSPITLSASGAIATVDGSHPPAAKTITIDFDRHGTINARGLSVCHARELQSRDTRAAERACRPAIVGHGKTTVQVQFPESHPFESTGPLVLFNGGVHHGVTTMYIHAYVSVPTPTALVTTVRIRHEHRGRYGTRAVARIPRIAGGSGSVTRFAFHVHRLFRRHGRKQSYLLASCVGGHFLAHADVVFTGGPSMAATLVRPCRAGG
ncbi:MAG TPA: hypothetical protein VF731_13895 [Solirubrobacterales bacterium]